MSSPLIRSYAWLIEHYLEGTVPLPGPVITALLKLTIEGYYRFAPALPELPPEWGGGQGPIAEESKRLMSTHYDLPLVLFENFLGPTMKYTMALWERGAKNLEEAQEQMLGDLCAKAGVRDGDHVLDIACGFGALSKHILERYPKCQVVALNLSQTQVGFIQARQSEPGNPFHTDRFRIIREDFSRFKFDRKFERIMVIGLFEHIRNLRLALEKIAGLLKPDGTVLLHYIAYNKIIRPMADPDQDLFFDKYIFPGGRFWWFNELFRYQEHLKPEASWFMNGKNYMRTLECWRENFWRNIGKIRAHPGMDDKFVRVWDLYLRFCITSFGGMGGRNLGNGQYLLRHAAH
jgi:cyclopropane-fatty-acyl-phospholipid synthase